MTDPSRTPVIAGIALSDYPVAPHLDSVGHHVLATQRVLEDSGVDKRAIDGYVNAQVSENAQFHVAVPTDSCAGVTDAQRYDPETNPGGVRCTIQDAAINMFGPEEKKFWTANEKKIGRGFVRLPVEPLSRC